MIRDLQELNLRPSAKSADDFLRAVSHNYAVDVMERFCAPMPTEEPFDWCVKNLVFDDTEVKGPFNPVGREYLRDIINNADEQDFREFTDIFSTGSGKTLSVMGRHAWTIVHNPRRALMVMPATKGEGGAETYVTSRFIPCLEATKAVVDLMPDGQRRLFMNSKKVRINGAHFGYVGANSPAQVASNRCGLIEMDEVDKFKGKLGNEAGTKSLVGERTEGVVDYKIFQNTTPTIETGLGWKCLQRSDFRRRFLPCPRCNSEYRHRDILKQYSISETNLKGWLTFAWSEQYCVLPGKFSQPALAGVQIPTGYIAWDKEAKRQDGEYDRDRIIRSARIECPHCKGHIRDEDKIWMDKNGLWIPTRESHGHKGHHLSALYSTPLVSREMDPAHKSLIAGRCLKFLDATEDGEGMKGFINSTLAEVDVAQEHTDRSVMEITTDKPRVNSVIYWDELSADRQARYPGFWYRVRRWTASILRPIRTRDLQIEFLNTLPSEEKSIATKLAPGPMPEDAGLYSAHSILAHIQRTDHWPRIADWLISNGKFGKHLTEFFQVEFQTDLLRLLEFICRQKDVNIPLGRQGDSEMVEFGSADSWEEIDEAQRRWKISNYDMLVDARFGSMDSSEVFIECVHRCPPNGFTWYSPAKTQFGMLGHHSKEKMGGHKPFAQQSWTPVLGYPSDKFWPNPNRAIKTRLPYTREEHDPNQFNEDRGTKYQFVFKLNAQWALSELARVRKKYAFTIARNCEFLGRTAESQPVKVAEYERHMKGYYWDEKELEWTAPGKKGGAQSKRHPNHGYDCEKNGLAWAVWKGIFRYEKNSTGGTK